MLRIPEQLMERALALGLDCCSDRSHHIIRPRQGQPWHLSYLKGHWVLFVNDTPQIHFSYGEVLAFLDRLEVNPAAQSPRRVAARSTAEDHNPMLVGQ